MIAKKLNMEREAANTAIMKLDGLVALLASVSPSTESDVGPMTPPGSRRMVSPIDPDLFNNQLGKLVYKLADMSNDLKTGRSVKM